MNLIFTTAAQKDGEQRLFPASKNRSPRIRKKLIKMHGGEFVRVPAIYTHGNTWYAHPSLRAQIEAATKEATRASIAAAEGE